MCGGKQGVTYFAHDPAHRLLPSAVTDEDGGGGEFTCDGCLVAGAGPRYRCAHPGCGFTLHEACARRFPRSLRSAVHPQHRLKRRATAGADAAAEAVRCVVCGEDVKGACYVCAAVAVHPLCARMPGTARGPALSGGHEAWLVRASAAPGDGEKKQKAAASCSACGRSLGAWRYRCVTCGEELHPRCLVPAADQCRGTGEAEGSESVTTVRGFCCGLLRDVTRCVAMRGTALHYRGYYNGQ